MLDEDTMRLILANVRSHDERRGDFQAQIGSLNTGACVYWRLSSAGVNAKPLTTPLHLIEYSARLMRHTRSA